jgi:ABC-type uncharacterized transport system fused permease/ATPase subunit
MKFFFKGTVNRIGEFLEILEESSVKKNEWKKKIDFGIVKSGDDILCQEISLKIPNSNQNIWTGLNFKIPFGKSLVIMGPSGTKIFFFQVEFFFFRMWKKFLTPSVSGSLGD